MSQTTRPPYTGTTPGSADGPAPRGSRPPAPRDAYDAGAYGANEYGAGAADSGRAFDASHAVVLFDPATDTSPYAASKRKKKGRQPARQTAGSTARPSASPNGARSSTRSATPSAAGRPAARGGARPAGPSQAPRGSSLRIVPDDDPGAIRRYAEAQHINDAQRRAGSSGQSAPVRTAPSTAPAQTPPRGTQRPAPVPAPAPAPASIPTSAPASAPAPAPSPRNSAPAPTPAPMSARAGRASHPDAPAWSTYPIDDADKKPAARRRPSRGAAASEATGTVGAAGTSRTARGAANNAADDTAAGTGAGPGNGSAQTGAAANKAADKTAGTTAGTGAGQNASFSAGEDPASNAPFSQGAPHARQVRARIDNERAWRTAMVGLTALASVLVSLVMLYFPAQELYLAMRENERLTDELNRNDARNEQMQKRIKTLQSTEGIQDEAHRLYNLVLPGENSVAVVGVDYEEPSNAIPAEVPRGSGENTHTWATDLMDSVFGVTGPSASTATAENVATITEGTAGAADANPDADIVAQGDGTA